MKRAGGEASTDGVDSGAVVERIAAEPRRRGVNQASYKFSTKHGSLAPLRLFMDSSDLANMSSPRSHVLVEASLEGKGQ
jgi:hypothetical protein